MHCHFMVNSLPDLWFICGTNDGSVAGLNLCNYQLLPESAVNFNEKLQIAAVWGYDNF